MRVQFHQLAPGLKQGLVPVYLVFGNEPLQLAEASEAVRGAARSSGFEERVVLEAESGFDWSRLLEAACTLSLFSSRKLIELRLESARIGRDGSEAVRGYCRDPSPDNLLLILAPDLERQELQAKWVQDVDRIGILLQVRQIVGRNLVNWIDKRLRDRGLRPHPEVPKLLAECVEGNLPAAAQEIEKLRLLYGAGELDTERLAGAISDSARYDLFALTDAALAGDRIRVHRIINTLAAEGTAPALVLWVLARELRMLAAVSHADERGATGEALRNHKVWESRQGLIMSAVKRLSTADLQELVARCAESDRQIKGLMTGEPWQTLAVIADDLARARVSEGFPFGR